MKYRTLFFTTLIAAIIGALLFAYCNGIIIIRYPSYDSTHAISHVTSNKKQITLYYWHNEKWNHEKIELMWSHDTASSLHYLLNSWLTYLDEEHVMHKKITVQTVLLTTDSQHTYISFDRNPLDKEQSTYEKWLFIEGLLKTLRENVTTIRFITFLVHHQPLHDAHLDFCNPWPITGFLT